MCQERFSQWGLDLWPLGFNAWAPSIWEIQVG